MKSLLLATTSAFYPPYQGDSVRLLQIVSHFRERGWRVHVVHWHSDEDPEPDYAGMAARCDGLTVVRADPPDPSGRSERCDDWCPDELARLVGSRCADLRPDAVIAQYVHLSKCLSAIPDEARAVKVLDADNLFTGRREVFESAGYEYDWFSTHEEEEARCLRRADVLLATQENEAAAIGALVPDRPVILAPPAERARLTAGQDSDRILITAASDPENAGGIRRFAEEALPVVRRAHPRVTLTVTGHVDPGLGESVEGVEHLGYVDDLVPVYDRSAVVLNTTPCGTGLKSKTARALCHGKCLVSTPAGVQGLERFPDAYLVAHSSGDFARILIRLFDDRRVIRRQARAAFEFARTYFDPAVVFGRVEAAIEDARSGARAIA